MKIIPAIDIMDGAVVRLQKGDPRTRIVYSKDPVGVAASYQTEGADMIHVVDLDATLGRGSNIGVVMQIASLDVPVQVAGGIRSMEMACKMAEIADRIVLGTLAFDKKSTLGDLLCDLGSNKIVIAVDHANEKIVTHGWQKETKIGLYGAMQEFVDMGVTEFLLTDVSRDGMMRGPNISSLEKACATGKNVIASGGISGMDDVRRVGRIRVKRHGMSDKRQTDNIVRTEDTASPYGVILGKALYEKKITIKEAKRICR